MNLPLFKAIAILPFITAFFLAFISIPSVIKIASYFGLVDDPANRPHPAHTETRVIPRAGGLALLFGVVISTLVFIPFTKGLLGIILGAVLLVFVGLWDDKEDVHPYIRFGANILSALLVVLGGVGITYITNPLGNQVIHFDQIRWNFTWFGQHSILPLADIIAIIWIAWTENIVGWSGGVDGQMPGFVVVAALVIGLLSFNQLNPENFPIWTGTTLAFITAGAYLGFLPWNFFPQKIMPGYGGKSLAGFLLGTLSILTSAKFGTALLVLGIPMIDALYVLITRVLSRNDPTKGGRSHLHHRLLDAGWSKRRVALFYWIVSVILGTVALNINAKQKFFTVLVVAAILFGFILWLKLSTIFLRKSDHDNGSKI